MDIVAKPVAKPVVKQGIIIRTQRSQIPPADLQLLKITVTPLTTLKFVCPKSGLTLAVVASAFRENKVPFIDFMSNNDLDDIVKNIATWAVVSPSPSSYYLKYMQIKSGLSVIGGVAVHVRPKGDNIDFVVRYIQATHTTPQMYTVTSRSWNEGRHHPWGGGVHTVTEWYATSRDPTDAEGRQIYTAMVGALTPHLKQLQAPIA